jgi:hypothetical protein
VFNGKMVRVRASAMGLTIKDLWIDDLGRKPACSAWMGVVVVLPEQVRPKPELDAIHDASFQQFFDDIRSMNVEATWHIDAAQTALEGCAKLPSVLAMDRSRNSATARACRVPRNHRGNAFFANAHATKVFPTPAGPSTKMCSC